MKLIHYTDTPLEKIEYREERKEPHFKPAGLWVSDDDDFGWLEWCKGEGFHPERLVLAYEIKLIENHNILLLKTEEEVRMFSDKFSIKDDFRCYVEWRQVKAKWSGIIITPYQWNLRLAPEFMWYYAWDCASGCIWNPDVIESFDTCQTSS